MLIINGENVSDEALYDEFEAIKLHYQNLGEVVCCDRDEEFHALAKENVVNRTLLKQESIARFGVVADEDAAAKLAELKQEHGGEERFYQNTGLDPENEATVLEKVAMSISVDRLVDVEIGEGSEPGETELQQFHRDNIDSYMKPEEVSASHMSVEPQDAEGVEKAFADLKAAREKVLDGADFNELAQSFLKTEEDKVDLGFFKRGDLLTELEVIAFSMRDGETSPVICTQFGYHILHRTGYKPSEPIPLEEIRETVVEHFLADRRERLMCALLDGLKAKGKIEEVAAEVGN
jgi:parvulin-like peptidyl-prolyl isomerase